MKMSIVVLAACFGTFVVGQANLAQAEDKTRSGGFLMPAVAVVHGTAPNSRDSKLGQRKRSQNQTKKSGPKQRIDGTSRDILRKNKK